MKKLLLPYSQSCRRFSKGNFGLNSFLLLSFFAMSFAGLAQTGSGGPDVDAGPDVTLDCGVECTDLTADYVVTGASTDYNVTSIPYNPPFSFTGLANPISVNTDDVWSSVINLPFDFCFFDDVYQKVIIGSNGVISFETSAAGQHCSYVLGEREALPNPSVHKNAIMLYHDINPLYGDNEIGWELLGVAPYRTLVVSFSNVPYYNGSSGGNNAATSTFQMVMYEATNAIEFFVESKPDPHLYMSLPINGGRAVLGIQNKTGTQGYTPPGRNTSVWSATNEAWRFTPSGDSNVEFAWLDEDGNVISTDTTITVCPTEPVTTYTAQATYINCNGDIIIESDDVTVTLIDSDFDITLDLGPDLVFCDTPSYEIVPQIEGDTTGATYLWSPGGETTETITVSASDTYTLEITQDGCSVSDSVNLLFLTSPDCNIEPVCETIDFEENFGAGPGRAETPYTNYTFKGTGMIDDGEYALVSNSAGLNLGWFTDMEDHTGDLDGRMMFVNASFDPDEFYRRTITLTPNVDFTFNAWITTVYDTSSNICQGNEIPSNVIFRIEDTSGNTIAETNTGDIFNGSQPNWQEYAIDFNSQNHTNVQLVLINNSIGGCGNDLAIDDITLRYGTVQPTVVTPPDMTSCAPAGSSATFDLEEQIPIILDGQDPALFNVSFHTAELDAQANINPIIDPSAYENTSDPETIYVRVENANQPSCFSIVSFQLTLEDGIDITTDLPTDLTLCSSDTFPELDATPTNAGIDLSLVAYEWTNANGDILSTDATYTPTEGGILTVEVTYPPCALGIFTIDIIVTDQPILDLGADKAICEGDSFEIIPTITGDITGITYLWSTGETTPTITVNESGTYTLEITVGPCTATDSIEILISEPILVDLGADFDSCFDHEIILEANVEGDPQNMTYEWLMDGVLLAGETDQSLSINQEGEYTVIVTNTEGCTGQDSIIIGLRNDFAVVLNDDFETCFDDQVVLEATTTDENSNITYVWTFNGTTIDGETNSTLIITEIGNYTVTATLGSCSATDSVTVSPGENLEVILEADFEICPNERRTIKANTSEEGVTFKWFLNGTEIAGETGNTLEIMIEAGTLGTQTYSVEISSGGCTGTDSVDVRLYPVGNCTISQGLSPNGDGYNDTLDLTFLNDRTGIKKLQIFNRLGTLVFDKTNYTNEWAGKTNGGDDLPSGTYFYVIDLNGNDAVYGQQHTGWIYLNQEAN